VAEAIGRFCLVTTCEPVSVPEPQLVADFTKSATDLRHERLVLEFRQLAASRRPCIKR
jgi:hypothetical protein